MSTGIAEQSKARHKEEQHYKHKSPVALGAASTGSASARAMASWGYTLTGNGRLDALHRVRRIEFDVYHVGGRQVKPPRVVGCTVQAME